MEDTISTGMHWNDAVGCRMKAKVNHMDDGRKKIWICVLSAVAAAVIIGILYWFSVPSGQSGEGFLIRSIILPRYCTQWENTQWENTIKSEALRDAC